MFDLSIIVLSYNTRELLLQCLESIQDMEHKIWNMELIVVDNGSTDGTVEAIKSFALSLETPRKVARRDSSEVKLSVIPAPSEECSAHLGGDLYLKVQNFSLRLIENRENLGFAKGNNVGIKGSSGKYILLLNSDTVVYPNTLVSMIQFIDTNPWVGAATCRVELADGSLDPACHRGFPTPWASLTYFLGLERLFPKSKIFGQYHLGYLPMDKPHEIDSPSGAFYMIRRKVIDQVGLLDEDYFMYGEDLDWSYRIKQAGWKIMYYPYVKIIHFKKQSGREKENPQVRKQTTVHFYETMKIFYKKHYLNKYPRWVGWIALRMIDFLKSLKLNSLQ